jgi:hypothetical protein
MRGICAVGLSLAVLLTESGAAAPVAATVVPSGFNEHVRLDWEAGKTRRGKPVIQGYVLNDYFLPAHNVILLVETLDSSGAVVTRTTGFVVGLVQSNDRGYFEVPLKTTGAAYRVTVTSLDWRGLGGGGGM